MEEDHILLQGEGLDIDSSLEEIIYWPTNTYTWKGTYDMNMIGSFKPKVTVLPELNAYYIRLSTHDRINRTDG